MAIASIMTSVVVIFIFPFDGQRCYYLASIIWAAAILVSNEFAVLILELIDGPRMKSGLYLFLSVEVEIVYFNFGLSFRDFFLHAYLVLESCFGHFFVLKF